MDCSIASLLHTLGRDFEPIIFEGQSHIRPPWLNTYHMYTIYIYISDVSDVSDISDAPWTDDRYMVLHILTR